MSCSLWVTTEISKICFQQKTEMNAGTASICFPLFQTGWVLGTSETPEHTDEIYGEPLRGSVSAEHT